MINAMENRHYTQPDELIRTGPDVPDSAISGNNTLGIARGKPTSRNKTDQL